MNATKQAYALTAVMLFAAILFYLIGKMVFGGKAYAMYSKASVQSTLTKLSPLKGFLAMSAFVVVIGLAVLPHISVIFTSLAVEGSWYKTVLPASLTFDHFDGALSHKLAVGSR